MMPNVAIYLLTDKGATYGVEQLRRVVSGQAAIEWIEGQDQGTFYYVDRGWDFSRVREDTL